MDLVFPFGFEGRICDLIVSSPDNCLSLALQHSRNVYVFV